MSEEIYESLCFHINVNNILGQMGPYDFDTYINHITKAIYVLQKEKIPSHTHNIMCFTNKFCGPGKELSKIQISALLEYLVSDSMLYVIQAPDETPMWLMNEPIFEQLCYLQTAAGGGRKGSSISASDK